LSDNNQALLLGGILGATGVAAAAMFLMAWLMRHPPVEGLFAQGLGGDAPAFTNDSGIFEPAGQQFSNAAYTT
jgi:hypothetical protein